MNGTPLFDLHYTLVVWITLPEANSLPLKTGLIFRGAFAVSIYGVYVGDEIVLPIYIKGLFHKPL